MSQLRLLLPFLACLGFVACATAPVRPGQEIAKAELAIRQAETSGAPSTESAADLELARDKLERARQAEREEEHARARRLAAEAVVDAQLAEARAEANEAHQALVEIETHPSHR
jgi:hypothetical protein